MINSFVLHLIAMALMLCDHMWGTVLSQYDFLTWIGRIAFPIFAFMIVEGYFHTHDVRKYMKRLLFWAFVSEIPFNLMISGSPVFPFYQNVLWTFLLGLLCIIALEKIKTQENVILRSLGFLMIYFMGYLSGFVIMSDYYGYGILTMLVFYTFRGNTLLKRLGQFIGLVIINAFMIGGLEVPLNILGFEFWFPEQAMAVLALIPIWLYNGKQGPHNKIIQTIFYAFYPLHMLILALLSLY